MVEYATTLIGGSRSKVAIQMLPTLGMLLDHFQQITPGHHFGRCGLDSGYHFIDFYIHVDGFGHSFDSMFNILKPHATCRKSRKHQ